MYHSLHFLMTLAKPSGEIGKIILLVRNGEAETQWSLITPDQEETVIYHSEPELEQAWQHVETLLYEKVKEGFILNQPWMTQFLSTIPPRFLMMRKLECFASQSMNSSLFLELKKWRKHAASASHIPPYFIGTDKLLSLIATYIPRTEDQLLQIPGIGNNKVSLYGRSILEITQKYEQIYSFPLDWINQKVTLDYFLPWFMTERKQKEEKRKARVTQEMEEKLRLLEMIEDQMDLDEIAERLSISMSELLKRIRSLDQEGYDIMSFLEREVEQIQEKSLIEDIALKLGGDRLKPIYEKMYGDEGDATTSKEVGQRYNRIRLVCTYLQLKLKTAS